MAFSAACSASRSRRPSTWCSASCIQPATGRARSPPTVLTDPMASRDVVPGSRLRQLQTSELDGDELVAIRLLLDVAFGDDEADRFTDDDWAHALGGTHVVLDIDGTIVSHAAVVEREIHFAEKPLRTGYVEAVATAPEHHGRGFGSIVMEAV